VKELKSLKQRVWVWLARLSISIHAGMFIVPVGQFVTPQRMKRIRNQGEEDGYSIICTYTNQHKYYETKIYICLNRMHIQYKLLECSLEV